MKPGTLILGKLRWDGKFRESARSVLQRMYGDPIDINKVWEDRDALYDAAHSTGEKPEVYLE